MINMIPTNYSLTSLPPLSLYIHIPWCIQKCPYCDFNSHTIKTTLNEQTYIQALLTDLTTELPNIWGRPIETIFIGGGTPSVFSGKAINQLLSGVRSLVKLQPNAEITLEANPSTFEREKFHAFKEAGINRLSIGVQSFDNEKLKALGRIHNSQEAHQAIETAKQIFERINIDLMYALPHQTIQAALNDIKLAIQHNVSHISAYHLTLEPNTVFGHTPPQGLPEDENAQDIEDIIHQTLKQSGFQQYETSAFSKHTNHQARHNLNYWQFGDYIGIGAGAHGKISYPTHIERTTRRRHPNDYLQAMHHRPQTAITRTTVQPKELPFEFMMNALRLIQGVPTHYFQERTGIPIAHISQQITQAQQKGLLDSNPTFLRPTKLGQRFLNDLIEIFL